MTDTRHPKDRTTLLCIDPYNDFLAEDGKMWPALSEVSISVDLHANLVKIRATARKAGMPIFILPHHRHHASDFEGWAHLTPSRAAAHQYQLFTTGSWGGDWYDGFGPDTGDIVVKEHWGASSFANTDLGVQLRQHGITHVSFIGLTANASIGASARYGALFRSMMDCSGPIRMAGGAQFITTVDMAWNLDWVGTKQMRSFSIKGDILSITTAETVNPVSPERTGQGRRHMAKGRIPGANSKSPWQYPITEYGDAKWRRD